MEQTIYDAAGGRAAFDALAHAWHQRCLADPIAAHPFEHPGHPDHLGRLAAYWAEALGGPPTYSATMADETHVSRMHAGEGEHPELDERVVACFDAALVDVGLADDQRLRDTLSAYFRWSTERLAAYPDSPDDVPQHLPLPHWSWDGPVGEPR